MQNASNTLANWLWKDLYVWPQGRMGVAAYIGGLLRILIVYVLFTQIFTVFGPLLFAPFFNVADHDANPFRNLIWGELGAIALIAFPVWSLFQRRINDMRPDIRQRLGLWPIAFPIILAGLIGLMLAHALGISTPLDGVDLGRARFWFAVILFSAAFAPGGEKAVTRAKTAAAKLAPDLFQTASQKAAREALAAQIAVKPVNRPATVPHRDRPKPGPIPSFPPVMVRTRALPKDGRVKPGWFA